MPHPPRQPVLSLQLNRLHLEGFHDPVTGTASYLVADRQTGEAALVDSVLDYDAAPGRLRYDSAQSLLDRVQHWGYRGVLLLETHLHADHLSAAAWLKQQLGGQLAIGQQITTSQKLFGPLFHAEPEFATDGRQFDHLLAEGDTLCLGGLTVRALHTPGHTPACITYLIETPDPTERVALVGDTLFRPDYGTARCDFPGGDARTLYRSIRKILALPDDTRIYTGHDYPSADRPASLASTVAEQRHSNIHAHDGISEDDFVALRQARDASLPMPALILPSVQINMRGGQLPPPESSGRHYLRIPLNTL